MLRRSWKALVIVACLVACVGPEVQAQEGSLGWVGLYGPEQLRWLENENRINELCGDSVDLAACYAEVLSPAVRVYPLYAEPDESSRRVGELVVVAVPGRGLTAHFRAFDSTAGVRFQPDLFLQDWGYGPYFHQTITQREGEWFQLPPDPWEEPVWLHRGGETDRPSVLYVQAGDIVDIRGEGMYVVAAEAETLLLRSEQPADMWCDEGEPPPLVLDEPTRYSRRELVDSNGHLIVRPKYMKGC